MIQMICNGCGNRIQGTKYYTINIQLKDFSYQINNITATSICGSYLTLTDPLSVLNAEEHYCEECKNKVAECISNLSKENK